MAQTDVDEVATDIGVERVVKVVGFVASSQRRRIFVNAGRVTLDADGARMRSWDVDVNPFKAKPGEINVASAGTGTIPSFSQ